MSKTKNTKPRQVDFSSAVKYLSQMVDERTDMKFLENSKQITGPIASLKARIEVLEDLLMEKLGETEASLSERVLIRIEKQQGFQQIDAPAQLGSIVRIKVKEEVVGAESPTNPMTDAFMVIGQNQVHPIVDTMLIGASAGDTKSDTLPNPKDANQTLKITVFLSRVFKGQEVVKNEEAKPETEAEGTESTASTETVEAATRAAQN